MLRKISSAFYTSGGRTILPCARLLPVSRGAYASSLASPRAIPPLMCSKNSHPGSVRVYKCFTVPTSIYIGQKRAPAELILQRVQQHPGMSPKQLGLGLPLSKRTYITALNDLLGAGTVVCTFKDNHMPMLHLSSHTPVQGTVQASDGDDRLVFHSAYNDVGHGRSFVRIHRLRDALPWPRERFDRVLQALVADYTVELHGGDPSVMTEEELRHSFTDADGTLYIALSWRGHPDGL